MLFNEFVEWTDFELATSFEFVSLQGVASFDQLYHVNVSNDRLTLYSLYGKVSDFVLL